MTTMKTISATVPANVKAEAMALAKAHGTTVTALIRELLARTVAGDKEALAWIEEARKIEEVQKEYSQPPHGETTAR